jgi:hypothetical protein
MKREQKIMQEIEKTLDLFERPERLKPNPFLYSRVQAQLDSLKVRKTWLALLKPVFLALLLTLNILTAVYFFSNGNNQGTSTFRSELKSEFVQEYGLEANTNEYSLIQ